MEAIPKNAKSAASTPTAPSMRYADNIDYLLASVLYLGTHTFYWARSPSSMASELSLDQDKLADVFRAFPGIYRSSKRTSPQGEHYYALQARYALKEGGDTADPEEVSYIRPLDHNGLQLIINFILHSAEQERTAKRTWVASSISVFAAIVAATAAITAALLK